MLQIPVDRSAAPAPPWWAPTLVVLLLILLFPNVVWGLTAGMHFLAPESQALDWDGRREISEIAFGSYEMAYGLRSEELIAWLQGEGTTSVQKTYQMLHRYAWIRFAPVLAGLLSVVCGLFLVVARNLFVDQSPRWWRGERFRRQLVWILAVFPWGYATIFAGAQRGYPLLGSAIGHFAAFDASVFDPETGYSTKQYPTLLGSWSEVSSWETLGYLAGGVLTGVIVYRLLNGVWLRRAALLGLDPHLTLPRPLKTQHRL